MLSPKTKEMQNLTDEEVSLFWALVQEGAYSEDYTSLAGMMLAIKTQSGDEALNNAANKCLSGVPTIPVILVNEKARQLLALSDKTSLSHIIVEYMSEKDVYTAFCFFIFDTGLDNEGGVPAYCLKKEDVAQAKENRRNGEVNIFDF